MNLRYALKTAKAAAKANLLPGLLLQALMVVFLALYVKHEGTRQFLADVANLKHEAGYTFAFISYVISAALLPEILRVGFFQNGRMTRWNLWNFLTAAPAWGCIGMLVDLFYRCQAMWFGTGNDWLTILCKMLVDQFIYSPFVGTPLTIAYFAWRDMRFRPRALKQALRPSFLVERVFMVQVAGWCIWIPGVCLVYFMPSEMQVPVAVLIQCFWVLVFTLVNKSKAPEKPAPSASAGRKV